MKCINCNEEIGDIDFHNKLCHDCWIDEWARIVEKHPMISPELLNKEGDE